MLESWCRIVQWIMKTPNTTFSGCRFAPPLMLSLDRGNMDQASTYNPDWVAARYDEYGEHEWERFSRSPVDAVSLFIHTH